MNVRTLSVEWRRLYGVLMLSLGGEILGEIWREGKRSAGYTWLAVKRERLYHGVTATEGEAKTAILSRFGLQA